MSRKKSDPSYELQRIRVNADGYDNSGAYWGAGPDVFIATSQDNSDQVTVRAKTVRQARDKLAAELARAPTAQPVNSDAIGGNAPRKTRYEIAWTNPLSNETIKIRITHAREYLSSGSDHIEVESITPSRAPLPITETGYRSHFIPALELMNAGGPVTFVTAWIEQEAKGKAWRKAATAKQQGDLFSWADAQGEVGERRAGKGKSSRPKNAQTKDDQVLISSHRNISPTPRRHDGKTVRRQKTSRDPA